MKHVKICSLVTLAVIALLLAVAHCGREADAQGTPDAPLCPTPTQPNPVTVTGFEASGDNLFAFAFGVVFTVVALVVAIWWWLWVRGKGVNYFPGQIDDVEIYHHALSPEEVAAKAQRAAQARSIVKGTEE